MQASTAATVWLSSNNALAMPASERLADLESSMGRMLAAR
jgi:hypothetical protein